MNNNLLHRLFLLAALLTGGCAIDQKNEVTQYRKVIDNNTPAGVTVASGEVVTLTDALRLANQNTESLSVQGEDYLQALIDKDKAFAAFLPTLNLAPTYALNSAGNATFGTITHTLQVPADGQINLFNGFRDFHALRAADATIEQQKQLVLDAQQTILLDVAQTYYQTLTDEQSVDVLKNSLVLQQANLDNMNAQAKVGTVSPLVVAQAESEVAQTLVSLNQSNASVANDRAMLAYLVSAPIENNPLRDDFQPPGSVEPVDQLKAQAEAGRQDLLAANAAVKSARENVEVAFGQYYPTLAVNLNYILYSETNVVDGVNGGGAWTGLFSVNLPIFTAGLIHADVRTAWSQFRQAALTQAQLRRNIDQLVETAFTNYQLSLTQLNELQVEVKAAHDAYYYAEAQYKAGTEIYLNVLTAQNSLLSTQLQLTTAQFNTKTAYFSLLRAMGELNLESGVSATRPSEEEIRNLATQPATQPIRGQ
ncbi:MAG: TolC family protein [Tepidisphaeraceae bacterium]|jgi:outer membrane protein TolC